MNEDDTASPDTAADSTGVPAWVADPERAYAEIKRLRQENAAQRQARKAASADEPTPADQAAKIADLEAQLKTASLTSLRAQIAAEVGLPPKLAARLRGDSEADLRRDAEDLRALVPGAASGSSTTTPLPSGGAAGETDVQRRARLFGGSTMFTGGRMVFNGDSRDLD